MTTIREGKASRHHRGPIKSLPVTPLTSRCSIVSRGLRGTCLRFPLRREAKSSLWNSAAIRLATIRETGASRHHGGPIKCFQSDVNNTSRQYCTEGFKGTVNGFSLRRENHQSFPTIRENHQSFPTIRETGASRHHGGQLSVFKEMLIIYHGSIVSQGLRRALNSFPSRREA